MTPDQQGASASGRPAALASALADAFDLVFALARAHASAGNLAGALARAHASDVDVFRARDAVHHLATAHGLANDLTLASRADVPGGAQASNLASALDAEVALARARASDLADDLAAGRAGVGKRYYANAARDLTDDLGRINARTSALAHRRFAAQLPTVDQVAELGRGDRSVPPSARFRKGIGARRVTSSAGRLVAAAAWLLPAGPRARYSAEYCSELHDLARAGAGRRQQLGYAARLLVRAVPLRLAVLAPRREKASP